MTNDTHDSSPTASETKADVGECFQCGRHTVFVCDLCAPRQKVCPRCWDLHERVLHEQAGEE